MSTLADTDFRVSGREIVDLDRRRGMERPPPQPVLHRARPCPSPRFSGRYWDVFGGTDRAPAHPQGIWIDDRPVVVQPDAISSWTWGRGRQGEIPGSGCPSDDGPASPACPGFEGLPLSGQRCGDVGGRQVKGTVLSELVDPHKDAVGGKYAGGFGGEEQHVNAGDGRY